MFITLLCLGLIAAAFVFFPAADIRSVKMDVAIFFAIALSMVELYKNGIKPFRNKWLLLLLVYLPISIYLSPAPKINLIGIDVTNFWAWQPFFQILVFFMFACAIASHDFKQFEFYFLLNTIAWCGFVMAAYIILQKFDADQFFDPIGHHSTDVGKMAGFLGNPTLSTPFVGLTIPFMIYIRKWWMVAIAFLSLYFANSQVAIGATSLGLLFLLATRGKFWLLAASIIALAGVLFIILNPKVMEDNERFYHWTQIAKDIKGPISPEVKRSFPFTGRGLGSFKFVYHVQHPGTQERPNRFHQAHNDPLEFTYNCGLVGIFLLLSAFIFMAQKNFSMYEVFVLGNDYLKSVLLSSFAIISLAALGTFVWQIGTTCFYSAVVIGLLHNQSLKGGFNEKNYSILGT